MRVGLDIRWIFRETSGIGTYTRELVREFSKLKTPHEFALFYSDEHVRSELEALVSGPGGTAIRFEKVPYGLFSAKNQLLMPAVLSRLGIHVFHSPNYMIPFLAFSSRRKRRSRCVVTIHDVIPLLFPDFTPRARKNRIPGLFRFLMKQTARRADRIIAVSECSRRDIVNVLGLSQEEAARVVVVPNGVAQEFFSVERPRRAEGSTRIILYVGRFDPYKNLTGLMEIFAEARRLSKQDVRLRVVGSPDPRYPEPQQRAAALGLTSWVEWCGYCGGQDLARAYAEADVFVLPSKYEGFGLTVLEAMACGTPVVCSNRASLPEVAGDAAILRDPNDVKGFAEAIVQVLSNQGMAETLTVRGRERAKRFTWERAARQTLDVYEQAYREAGDL